MKKIESKDLIIGQVYYDIDEPCSIEPCLMKFEKRTEKGIYFSYVSGSNCYHRNENNLIPFLGTNSFFQKT